MPPYQLTYRAETSLRCTHDVEVQTAAGHRSVLRFSGIQPNDKHVRITTEIVANSSRDAQLQAGGEVIPEILDAFAFATGTQLHLRGDCEFTLKDETGEEVRRAIYVGERIAPNQVLLNDNAIADALQILQHADGPKLPLRWLRYGNHRSYTLDRFIFTWLAFEELAGDREVQRTCECGRMTRYRAGNRQRAFELFHATGNPMTDYEFYEGVWRRARSALFHGSRMPDPAFVGELYELLRPIWQACHNEIQRSHDLPFRARDPLPLEQQFNVYLFVEWRTTDRASAFAQDFPMEVVRRVMEDAEPGGIGLLTDDAVRLHPMQDAEGW